MDGNTPASIPDDHVQPFQLENGAARGRLAAQAGRDEDGPRHLHEDHHGRRGARHPARPARPCARRQHRAPPPDSSTRAGRRRRARRRRVRPWSSPARRSAASAPRYSRTATSGATGCSSRPSLIARRCRARGCTTRTAWYRGRRRRTSAGRTTPRGAEAASLWAGAKRRRGWWPTGITQGQRSTPREPPPGRLVGALTVRLARVDDR